MRLLVCALGLLAVACGPSVVGDDGDGGGDGDGDDGEADDGSSDADPDASGLTHTYVKLQFRRGASADSSPFAGTGRVTAFLEYGECISDFYSRHPELRADAVEGHRVFGPLGEGGEGWTDRLCAREDGFATCGVLSIGQSLEDVPAFGLTVVFTVEGDLEGHQLRVGPLPTTATAECGAGGLPVVHAGGDLARGEDGTGTTIWRPESFDPSEAVAGQDNAINVYVSRP
jgi:hypothetical protein